MASGPFLFSKTSLNLFASITSKGSAAEFTNSTHEITEVYKLRFSEYDIQYDTLTLFRNLGSDRMGLRDDKLDFWIQNGLNVMFIGKHGVGKTAMVKQAFERNNLRWRYFSAATMDPWVDFIGVPREQQDESGENSFLKLIRPKGFHDGTVEALFFDEFNRSPKKVRNAVMELLQFKSINGESFPNLKLVWAAVNPEEDEDETYDVEVIDPAQMDRFHVQIEIPYKPNGTWFKKTFGERSAKAAIGWWDELPEEEKRKVSPRRLDYALQVFNMRGDMRDVLPVSCNVSKLTTALNTGPITEKLEALMTAQDGSGDVTKARVFLTNENNYASAMKYIPESETMMAFFLPLLSKEKIASLMADNERGCRFVIQNSDRYPIFQDVCKQMLNANTNQRLVKKIRRALNENDSLANSFATGGTAKPDPPFSNKGKKGGDKYREMIAGLMRSKQDTTHQRTALYNQLVSEIPEEMNATDALATLELLTLLVNRMWTSSISAKPLEHLVPMINHCIECLHKDTGYDWTTILQKHGKRIKPMLEKLKDAAVIHRVFCPNTGSPKVS